MSVYQFRENYSLPVPAQVIRERLELLKSRNDTEYVTTRQVIEDARPEDSPLHSCFTWDQTVAAQKWNEHEAQRVIRCYCYVADPVNHPEVRVIENVHVVLPDVGPCYVSSARILTDEDLRKQVEHDALVAFQALKRRYEHLASLAEIFAAIEAVEAKLEARAAEDQAEEDRKARKPARSPRKTAPKKATRELVASA